MTKIALLIIYNHRFDKNIERLEKLYEDKFSYIYHIMPFYDGEKGNVIPVYASSYQFQSYIAQAYQHIKDKGYTHYFFVADDMILNPDINEHNLFEKTGIGTHQCYITDIRELYHCYVAHHVNKMRKYHVRVKGVEVERILPSKQDAEKCFQEHNLQTGSVTTVYLMKVARFAFYAKMLRQFVLLLFEILFHRVKVHYPLVWGYSDILLLPADIMKSFTTYCGAFAATGLFVEYAIPTSLIFSSNDIITGNQLKLRAVTQVYPHKVVHSKLATISSDYEPPTCWDEEYVSDKYHFDLQNLLTNFPKDMFFIHSIKLSTWKMGN